MDKKEIKEKIFKWFIDNPYPDDKKVHNLAEELGIDPDKFETYVYGALSAILSEGKSKGKEIKHDPKELAMGIKVEMEHTTCPLTSRKIALDHLAEIPDYYTRLAKMEKEAGVTHENIQLEAGFEKNPRGWDKTSLINSLLEKAGFDIDIEKKTIDNNNFREVLFTGNNVQLVVMSVVDEIGEESHDDIDQFFRVEAGKGKAIIAGREVILKNGVSFIVPKGTKHNVISTGKDPLKIYTIYSPPNHPPKTVHKTREEAQEAEHLDEAGFEEKPRGWDKTSLNKYMKSFTKRMKGGVKAEGFFDKCVEKIKDKVSNPEGFCASLKDEAYGSTGWRGKNKSPKEISKDVKKAKFKVEAEEAINDYLDFITESDQSGIINDGAPLPNELITMLEYDEQPNWIGYCIREYEGRPPLQCKCLQAVKEYAAANPFYQYRIDRYIDRIMDNWDGSSDAPYPTQNPDRREINLGTTGRSYEQGYSNMDHETPGMIEGEDNPCWKGYEMVGWKKKGGKKVPNCVPIKEAEENKPLNKPFRTPGGPKKFAVYVKNDKGNVVKVTFGDPNMEIKRDDPERRKSFRARHNCDNPGPKWKAKYWSCRMWEKSKSVGDLTETGMASRIPSGGLMSDTEDSEGQIFYGEKKKLKPTNENFPDMSGGGGMGCRLPPADTMETEERDEDDMVHPPMKWSRRKGRPDEIRNPSDVINDKRLAKSTLKKPVSGDHTK